MTLDCLEIYSVYSIQPYIHVHVCDFVYWWQLNSSLCVGRWTQYKMWLNSSVTVGSCTQYNHLYMYVIKFISDSSSCDCLEVYSWIQLYIHVCDYIYHCHFNSCLLREVYTMQTMIKFISDNSTLAWAGVLNTKCIQLIGDTSTHVCLCLW